MEFNGKPRLPHPGHHPHGHHGDCRRGGPRKSILDTDRYAAMDADGRLAAVFRELSHMGRFHMEDKSSQNRILHILAQEGPMTQKVLTERMGVQSGSASEVLGKLEKAGLIARAASEADRRTVDVTLTDEGRAQAQRQAQARQARKAEMFAALSPAEKTALLSMLETLSRDWQRQAQAQWEREQAQKPDM